MPPSKNDPTQMPMLLPSALESGNIAHIPNDLNDQHMFSSDKNVETIAGLISKLKEYAGMQAEYVKLDVVDKCVSLLKVAAIVLAVLLLLLPVLLFLSMALAHALATWTGMAVAYCIVAAVYFVLLAVIICHRKRWIERPLVRYLTSLLLND